MDQKSKGVASGSKTDGERRRDELRKKKIPNLRSNWGSEKRKARETAKRSPRRHQPSYEMREIEIADIRIGEKRRSLNAEKLNKLMESISVLGLRQPITVRVIKLRSDWGNAKREYELVSGFHRLEARKQLGDTTIPCIILEGNKRDARKWEIAENLHRAELTALEHDEHVAEWVRLTEADQRISDQNVQKKGRGRPEGGISQAARKLLIKGRTQVAKRRMVERALKVASISSEVKEAVKKAGLDTNRSKLLKIAAEKTREAQLAKVHELAAGKSEVRAKRSSPGAKQKTTAATTPLWAGDKKVLKHLFEDWNDAVQLRRRFIKASPTVRERFIAKIRQDRSLSTPQHDSSTRAHWA